MVKVNSEAIALIDILGFGCGLSQGVIHYRQHFIDVIITNDTDPLWFSLPKLEQQRTPLYKNQYYAIFGCGDFANLSVVP